MAAGRVRVTMNQKVLVHLLSYARWIDRGDAPCQVTQQGIADALRVRRSHVTLALQGLTERALVEHRTMRVVGAARRKKAYALTPLGYERAQETRGLLASLPIHMLDDGSEVPLARVPERLGGGLTLADLLAHVRPDGGLDPRPLVPSA